jgi:hypothetical protein
MMFEFETFAYLDMPKTASSFICTVLQKFCNERKVCKTGHVGPTKDFDSSKFYFISVRDPLDLYISLYSHGCGGKGMLRSKMAQKGLSGLYDGTWSGFEFWLKFVLDPENERLMERQYRPVAKWIGFQSYRALNLLIPDFSEAAKSCKSPYDFRRLYEERSIAKYVVRFENLRNDLCTLLSEKLSNSVRLQEALAYVREAPPLNRSERIDSFSASCQLKAGTRKFLDERERLFKDIFGYGSQPIERPEAEIMPGDLAIGGDFVSAGPAASAL